MKNLEECESILEIRIAIDLLDRSIVRLLGQRFQYVKAAAKFKKAKKK